MNPIDWAAWLHARLFVNNPPLGFVVAAALGAILATLVWMRGVEKYSTDHAAQVTTAAATRLPVPIDDAYSVRDGKPAFRIDTLDGELNKAGLMRGHPFDGLSPPQAKPTPEGDTNPAEYFLLKNGLYLRATRPIGGAITDEQREKAHAVILAHEARLHH